MDMDSRRRFVNSMMAATAAAMGGGMIFGGMPIFGQQSTVPDGGPPYVPMGGVQTGPDGVNGNPPPGPIGAGTPQQGGARGGPRWPRRCGAYSPATACGHLLDRRDGDRTAARSKIPGTSRTTPSSRWTT